MAFDQLRGVTKGIRNLPDPSADPAAPAAPEPDSDDLTCPKCGASLSLKAVAKDADPDAAAVPAAPMGVQAPSDTGGPGF